MTIEELTFAAFQQGREQGREESAAQIERLTHQNEGLQHDAAAYREIKVEYDILLARSRREGFADQAEIPVETIAEQAAQIERLRALLTRWSDYDDLDRIMGGVGAYEKLVAETDAALQPKEDNQ